MAKKNIPIQKAQPKTAAKTKNDNAGAGSSGWLTIVLIVLGITGACYVPSLYNEFVNWDDDPNITENKNIELVGVRPWGEVVSNIFDIEKGAVIGNYNPLTILTFAIEKSIAGGVNSPKLIHFNNLWLHLATVFFVMLLLKRMGVGYAGIVVGGLLFGIHPMRVESVAWATERKDVLFAVFFFAALAYYVKWIRQRDNGQPAWGIYIGMTVLALLSGLSKIQAVTLPLSMLALDYWFRRPLNFGRIVEKAPFWLISLAIGMINLSTLKAQGSTNDDITNFNFLDRLCIGAYSFSVYLYKLVLPYPMSPLYPYPKPLPVYVYLAPIIFGAACFLVWRLWKADRRMEVFGVAFFFFNVMFLLQIFGAGQGFLADRFTYVPYFGFFAIAGWYFSKYYEDHSLRGRLQAIVAVVGLICAFVTVKQIGIWKNGETLWSHVMKFEDNTNSLPYWNRGQYLRGLGKYEAALKDYTQAVTINPKNAELYNSRGKTYFDMAMSGKYKAQESAYIQKAIDDYNSAVEKSADKPKTKAESLINRGAAFGARSDFASTIRDISEGISLDPTNKNGYFNRSIAYYSLQQYDKALDDYKQYLKLDPFNANVWYEAGMIQRAMKRNPEAIADLSEAIRLNPKFGIAFIERARAYAQSGNKAAAQQDYQKARQLGAQTNAIDQQLMQ